MAVAMEERMQQASMPKPIEAAAVAVQEATGARPKKAVMVAPVLWLYATP